MQSKSKLMQVVVIPSSGRVHVLGVPSEHQEVTCFKSLQLNNKSLVRRALSLVIVFIKRD